MPCDSYPILTEQTPVQLGCNAFTVGCLRAERCSLSHHVWSQKVPEI